MTEMTDFLSTARRSTPRTKSSFSLRSGFPGVVDDA